MNYFNPLFWKLTLLIFKPSEQQEKQSRVDIRLLFCLYRSYHLNGDASHSSQRLVLLHLRRSLLIAFLWLSVSCLLFCLPPHPNPSPLPPADMGAKQPSQKPDDPEYLLKWSHSEMLSRKDLMLPPISLLSSWWGRGKKCGLSGALPVGFVVQSQDYWIPRSYWTVGGKKLRWAAGHFSLTSHICFCTDTALNILPRSQAWFVSDEAAPSVPGTWKASWGPFVVDFQSLSHVQLFVSPRPEAHQASLSLTVSQSLLESNVHWVGEAIQPSHLLSPPTLLAFSFSQQQGLFQWVGSSHQTAKRLKLQLQSFQWIFRVDLL